MIHVRLPLPDSGLACELIRAASRTGAKMGQLWAPLQSGAMKHVTPAIAFLLLAALAPAALSDRPADIPRHLAIARELVENIRPADNRYKLGGDFVSLPGDSASSRYAMTADCSGFLLAIFERAGYRIRSGMPFLVATPGRKRPRAEDFVLSIEQEKGFRRIWHVTDIRPGDLLAHAMLDVADQRQTGTTGHVFLVDSAPRKIWAWKPIVGGTDQYEVSIIDSNGELVGEDDTRRASGIDAGLGRGTIRVYADAEGRLVGWARTFRASDRFFSYDPRFPSDTKRRKAAVGRPIP